MKITKKEIEKILGYEIAAFKVTKRSLRGSKVSSMTITVIPKQELDQITVTIKPVS